MENHRTKILGFAFLLAGLTLCAFELWVLLGPTQYQATVKIRIRPDVIADPAPVDAPAYDPYPYFIQTEFEVIQSPVVLSKVVETLNLNVEWGKRYGGGRQLKTDEVVNLLKRRINLRLVRNTRLIEISMTSEDPAEVAKIANAIAGAYRAFRLNQRRQLMLGGIEVLTEQYRQEDQQIKFGSEKVEQLQKKLSVPNPEPDEEQLKTNYPAFFDERRILENEEDFYALVGKKIEQVKSDVSQPQPLTVKIIEAATPPTSPVGPDRLLGALLCAIGLFPSVGGFLLLKSSRRPSD
jgi:uncharacterized protein involved in exopolysaccharide biosynthesis